MYVAFSVDKIVPNCTARNWDDNYAIDVAWTFPDFKWPIIYKTDQYKTIGEIFAE